MGTLCPTTSETTAVAGDRVIGVNEIDGNSQGSLGAGFRTLQHDTLQGDRSGHNSLRHHGLCHQRQSWLIHIILETIQGSSFRSVVDTCFGSARTSMFAIPAFNLAASDIGKPSEYLSDLGFELAPDAAADVKQPTSGRHRLSPIPA